MLQQISQPVKNSQKVWESPQLMANSQEIQDHDRCQELLAKRTALIVVMRMLGLSKETMKNLRAIKKEFDEELKNLQAQNSQSLNTTEKKLLESLNPLESLKQKTCPTKTPLILTYF